ncbi:ABC transporter permease [Desulfosporosinus youngiae]|uniref:ABC-type transport system, involved in lipoprotein release, permease component n=1 Tax=Desulfosporosinus youngiae DSM 17734 TaxID=768710 RepID=H5XSN0_9FIRM|nr:FtsX-like permease family protein [Desulfosporosinus youngiae]EHQ87698.1 ABC-type transport system, involved in lipoprotein release, permease component [Desulfosporosinus youngiae DSM 17734]
MTLTDIAIQNLRRRKGRTLFLLLTFILVVGITVALNSLAKGMQDDLQKSLAQYGANLVITPKSEHFTLSYGGLSVPGVNYELNHLDYDSVAKLNNNPELMLNGIAPKLIGSAAGTTDPYLIIGVDFTSELKMKPWWHIDGNLPGENEVIIGSGLARKENLVIGNTLELNYRSYSIVGVMQETGGSEDNGVFTKFETARSITGIDSWSMIELNTAQPTKAAALLTELLPGAKVSELSQLVQGSKESVDRFSNVSLITSILLGLIGALIVFVTMTGSINDRTTEIGIFRAIGFRRQHILSILIREAFFVSLCGGFFGYLLGGLAPAFLAPITFQKSMSFEFHPLIALTVISASVIIGVVSTLLPARRAIHLDPLEALSSI